MNKTQCAHGEGRIALLTDAFLPHAGGSRVYYFNLYTRLAREFRQSVFVLTTRTASATLFDRVATFPGFKIVRRSGPLPDWRIQRVTAVIRVFCEALVLRISGRADMLHAGDLFPQGLACAWMKMLLGTPYLVFAHGEEITQTSRFRFQPAVRDLIYRRADAVVAANDFARGLLLKSGVESDRIHTIYPGVDSVRFSPRSTAAAEECGPTRRLTMLSVGRLVPHKGHRILLEALSALPAAIPRPRYLIAGDGPEREGLIAQAKTLGLANDVMFLGKVSEEELAGLYNACDVFALANCDRRGCVEGFGMVFLEAGACGKPVLAGRTGGTAGAVVEGVTGLMFDPEDSEEVSSALNQMLGSAELRRRMGQAGRQRAIQRFSWDESARRLHDVCRQVLNASGKFAYREIQSYD